MNVNFSFVCPCWTGRFITTYSAILLILVAFLEAQINFCFLSRSQTKHKKEKYARKSRRPQYVDNDQTADLEYVIPKVCEIFYIIPSRKRKDISNDDILVCVFVENRNERQSKTINGYKRPSLCKILGIWRNWRSVSSGGRRWKRQRWQWWWFVFGVNLFINLTNACEHFK